MQKDETIHERITLLVNKYGNGKNTVFASLIGSNIATNGGANQFFIGLILFTILATTINWWFYNRKGCEKPS